MSIISKNYYSPADQYIHEKNEGKPIPWMLLAEKNEDGEIVSHLFCPIYEGHQIPVFDVDILTIEKVFYSNSDIDAVKKYHEYMGWGEYTPHQDWDVENKKWKK